MKTTKPLRQAAKTLLAAAILMSTPNVLRAQNDMPQYVVKNGMMIFQGAPMLRIDINTFVDLGYGYAKDRYNVYYMGRVLPFVDPYTFQLKGGRVNPYDEGRRGYDGGYGYDEYYTGYMVTKNTVLYEGRKIEDAMANSFTDLGYDYAKDAFNVYYMGRKVGDATSSSFKVLTYGYAADAFNVYYMGVKMPDAVPSSFKVLKDGYAEDTFNTYYCGKKV